MQWKNYKTVKKLFYILVLLCLWNILAGNVFKNNSKLVSHLMMILWQEKYLVLKVHLVHVQPFYSCFHHVSFASEWPTAHQGLVSDDILSLYQNTPKGTTNTKRRRVDLVRKIIRSWFSYESKVPVKYIHMFENDLFIAM